MPSRARKVLVALVAAATLAPAALPVDADARDGRRLGQILRGVAHLAHRAHHGQQPTVDIRVGIQAGRGTCTQRLDQNADINLGFVLQRCDQNNLIANQDGFLNRIRADQR